LVSTPSTVVGRSQTLTNTSAPVERFHSVRKFLTYDGAYTGTCSTCSDDDFDTYSNWSSQRLSNIQDLTVSDEDLSVSDHWVS